MVAKFLFFGEALSRIALIRVSVHAAQSWQMRCRSFHAQTVLRDAYNATIASKRAPEIPFHDLRAARHNSLLNTSRRKRRVFRGVTEGWGKG
jgi:hypothetical protein